MKQLRLLILTSLCSLGILIFSIPRETSLGLKECYQERKIHTHPLALRYPELKSTYRNASSFNKKVDELIKEETKKLEDALNNTNNSATSASYYGALEYTCTFARYNILSIVFHIHFYSGGAHGTRYCRTLNYDLSLGKVLTLENIFKPNCKYLELLSSYCISNLKKSLGDPENNWIEEGAAPSTHYYTNWVFTPEGLKILFDEYQVTCYANGAQEVIIPYTHLKGFLKETLQARV